MAEDNQEHLQLEKSSAASEAFSFPELPFLDFHSAKLEDFMWFPGQKPVSDLEKYGVFTSVTQQSVGYDPVNRDHLEIQVLTAEIKPEKVARALDYARLFVMEWAAAPSAMKSHGRDRGDVFAATAGNGFDRFERVGVWRRGTSLLVVRASYDQDQAAKAEPLIARFLGSLAFDQPAEDSVESSLQRVKLPADANADYSFRLPENWQKIAEDRGAGKPYSGTLFTDSKDPNGNAAVSVMFFPSDKSTLSPTDEQLRQLAATVVGIELENLLPKVGHSLDEEAVFTLEDDEEIGDQNRGYIDAVTLQGSEEKIRAKTLLVVKGGLVTVIASLSAYPRTPSAIATMIHTDFVTQVATDDLREQLK